MPIPENCVIQVAQDVSELPAHVAKQIGNMWLRRYVEPFPNPSVAAIRDFKMGDRTGVLVWVLRDDGRVLAWALKSVKIDRRRHEVMLFVRKEERRKGMGDAMLDVCRTWLPTDVPHYYPHDATAEAFFDYRERKLSQQ
jgi:GNAT superfamily N-acetyltransferase